MNKRELKDMIEQQNESINQHCADKIGYINRIDELERQLHSEKAHSSELWQWYQSEQKRASTLQRCLYRIREILALATIEHKTHRERNEMLRGLIATIGRWSDNLPEQTSKELEEIPF